MEDMRDYESRSQKETNEKVLQDMGEMPTEEEIKIPA